MTAASLSGHAVERVSFRRLTWVGPSAVVLSVLAVSAVRVIAVALINPDPQFVPLVPIGAAVFAAGGSAAAIIVYAMLGAISRRPVWLFNRVAFSALILSFAPPLSLLLDRSAMPGTSEGGIAVLLVMHVVVWATTVGILTRLARS